MSRECVQGPSVLTNRASGTCNGRSMDSVRLHIALIILYLLFTCPRSAITCLQGVFVTTSSRRSPSAAETMSSSDVVLALLESLGRLAFAIYQASLLPLLASYHNNFRRLLVNSCRSLCYCCCCWRRYTAPIIDKTSDALTTATPATTHGTARKSVKFDMEAVEFEIQY